VILKINVVVVLQFVERDRRDCIPLRAIWNYRLNYSIGLGAGVIGSSVSGKAASSIISVYTDQHPL